MLTGMLMASRINIGFRHFLPAYVFMLMLAGRCVAGGGKWVLVASWCAVGAALMHTLSFGPDYLSYVSFPRHKAYLDINDSNVDWGQGVKEIAAWLDEHPPRLTKKVYVGDAWNTQFVEYKLKNRVVALNMFGAPPREGLLILSPMWEAGLWGMNPSYAALRACEPVAMIGHAIPVYDLDALRDKGVQLR